MARLAHDTYEEIKRKVVEFYKEMNVNSLPIDCFGIAQKLGFTIVKFSDLSEQVREMVSECGGDAYTLDLIDSNEKYIFYNDDVVMGKQRFSIMHELGHYVLGHKESDSELAESEADFFAKYALAPLPLLFQRNIDNYIDLAEQFEISKECAYYVMDNYMKWIMYGSPKFTDYENDLIKLFKC